jgi:uncharacterized protein YdhG (YjbR/CyaY superfamily)
MEGSSKKFKNVEEYISTFPSSVKTKLQEMRETILKAAPRAEEVISYNMPAFKLDGMLVWYAAFKNHIGFYPRASGIEKFKKELSAYKGAKGSIQFPMDQPLPRTLIAQIVKYRVKENQAELASKSQARKKTVKS